MARTIVTEGTNYRLYSDGTILLRMVRFSFVHLAEPHAGKPDKDGKPKTPKYSVTGLMPKKTHKAVEAFLQKHVLEMCAAKGGDFPKRLISANKFIRDGDVDSTRDEYAGHFTVNSSELDQPDIRGSDAKRIPQSEIKKRIQSGYWGDMLIKPWLQNNDFGKKCNAGLVAVQVRKKDTVFGESKISEEDIDETFEADEGGEDTEGFDEGEDAADEDLSGL
jgi:hypothetical protein